MKCLIELNHPKHYYQFQHLAESLLKDGHEVHYIAKDKDVLLSVLKERGESYDLFGRRTESLKDKIFSSFSILLSYIKLVRKYQPDVIISKASLFGTISARLLGCRSVIFPDSEVVALTNKVVAPLCSMVVTPDSFGLDYGKKHHRVNGFFESCYLSPSVFKPDPSFLDQCGLHRPYAVFRFIGWTANHDVGQQGISYRQKLKLVDEVSKYMQVYISSEKPLPSELEQYKLNAPSSKMHDVLALADLYVGDSQTMATEAALLGTPAIRSNSWVGDSDMTNFKILEHQYGLLRNLPPSDEVVDLAVSFAQSSPKALWVSKANEYNAHVGDINQEIVAILNQLK